MHALIALAAAASMGPTAAPDVELCLFGPHSLRFGPDGNLFVASRGNDSVKAYDGVSGAYLGDFVAAGDDGLEQPAGLLFAPPIPGDLNGDAAIDTVDFLGLLAAWGPNPGHPADLDGNGVVDTIDYLMLLGGWGGTPCS